MFRIMLLLALLCHGSAAPVDPLPRHVPPAGRGDAGLAGGERARLHAREPAEAAGGGEPEYGIAGGGVSPAGPSAVAGLAAGGGGQLHGGPVAVGAAAAVQDHGGRRWTGARGRWSCATTARRSQ